MGIINASLQRMLVFNLPSWDSPDITSSWLKQHQYPLFSYDHTLILAACDLLSSLFYFHSVFIIHKLILNFSFVTILRGAL